MSKVIKGIPAAPGVGMGRAHFLAGGKPYEVPKRSISKEDIPQEILKLEEALSKTREELTELRKKISSHMGRDHALIFEAHLLVLEDRTLIEEVIERIKKDKVNVEYAFKEAIDKYIEIFKNIEDEYLRDRIYDIQDVSRRVLRNFLNEGKKSIEEIKGKAIIVAYDLAPSQTASMHKEKVAGFITDIGGRTSHTAILARSLGIPAVVGTRDATSQIRTGDFLIVDGTSGKVIINPTEEEREHYRKEREKRTRTLKRYLYTKRLLPETKDGRKLTIGANIEFPEEIPLVLEYGAQGIGLYRTEYFYMNRTQLPSEEEQLRAYREVAQKVHPYPIIIRTLDLGGDKFLSQVAVPREMESFLGWRAIRFCLAKPDIFKTQLRAILRASVSGNLKLMYPMISGTEELIQANKILEECKKELKKEGYPFDEDIEVGAMIEVPSAALISDILAKYVDFFSIGTNDLIQYALAVDRANEKVAYLYEPAHPAVIRLIKSVVDSAHSKKIWVGMCGEMASEPIFIYLLIGIGLDELSMPPPLIPRAKLLVRSISYKGASEVVSQVLNMSNAQEVEKFCTKHLKSVLKDLYRKIIEG